MITLHGTYENGKISIDEKEKPQLTAPVEIMIFNQETKHPTQKKHLQNHKASGSFIGSSLSRSDFYEDRI